ncbi:MAG: choice-of-anchor tandem repeat GloVer-containing protein, partial [Bryobacteraceae bacterium]
MKNLRNLFQPSGLTPAGKPNAYKLLMALAIPCLFACPMAFGQTPTTVVTFDVTNGFLPYFGSLVQGANGDLFGTTYEGGANSVGTIFKLTPAGALTTLHSFDTTDGSFPAGSLVLAANGYLYGTTWEGGIGTVGTIFRITPAGALTSLHSFD